MRNTTSSCPFCGRALKARTVSALGRQCFAGYEECGCEGARADREARERAEEERRRRADEDELYRRLGRAGVPARYQRAEHPLAAELAGKVEEGRSLYIWGDNGTLKTTLAAAVVRRLVRAGTRCEMVNAVDLFIRLQGTYGTTEREGDVLARYSTVPVLVVDDLGKEQQTAWTISRVYSIVNARDGGMLPTVVTSNFPISQLARRMAGADESAARAIASRLAGSCEAVRTDGGDRRIG